MHTSLKNLAELAVPAIADCCAIHLAGADGGLELVELVERDPHRRDRIREIVRGWPLRAGSVRGAAAAFRAVEPLLVQKLTPQLLGAYAVDDTHGQALRSLGLRSAIVVPLLADDQACGTLTLLTHESGREYGPADIESARELGARISEAVARSR